MSVRFDSSESRRPSASVLAGVRTPKRGPRSCHTVRTVVTSLLLAVCCTVPHDRSFDRPISARTLAASPITIERSPDRSESLVASRTGRRAGFHPAAEDSVEIQRLARFVDTDVAPTARDTVVAKTEPADSASSEAVEDTVVAASASRGRRPRRSGPPDAPFAPWTQFTDEQDQVYELVVELVISGGPAETVFTLGRDTVVYLPLRQFMDLTEMEIRTVNEDSTFSGVLHPMDLRFAFDTQRDLLIRGDSTRPLPTETAIWRDGELYVTSQLVEFLFEVRTRMNWDRLRLSVQNTELLPIVRRLDRERRRRIGNTRIGSLPRFATFAPTVDGAVLDWAVSSATRDPVENSSLQFGLGALVSGGSLDLRYTRSNTTLADDNDFRYSWTRAWPTKRAIRQIRLGEFGSTGRQVTLERGVSISNAPFIRATEFADEVLRGELPSGWEVELYRDGRLVGFTQVDETGRYGLDLPVRYGQNPLELVAYGPRGEVVRTRRAFEIPFNRLPADQFEYGLSAGKCVLTNCDAHTNVDVRYGVTKHVTVQAGADYFWRDSLANLAHPYALTSVALSRVFSVTGEAVLNGLARLETSLIPSQDLRVTASHTWFDTSNDVPIVGSVVDEQLTNIRGVWRLPSLQDRVLVEADFTRATGPRRTFYRTRVQGTLIVPGGRLNGAVVQNVTDRANSDRQSDVGFEVAGTAVLNRSWGPLRGTLVRARSRITQQSQIESWSANIGRNVFGPFRVEGEASWFRNLGGMRFGVSLTTTLPGLRSVSRNRYAPDQGVQGQQSFEGSVLWNRPGGRAQLSDGRSTGRGGVGGVVYVDENGNGQQDIFEIVVPDVRVRVGGATVRTDSAGQFSVWDLPAFEHSVLEIDSLTIANPLWVPALGRGYVSATPNSFTQVQIPLIETGEVIGRVQTEAGRPVGGVRVIVRNLDTGNEATVVTFSDGTFYLMGIRHGRNEAMVDNGSLQRLNASSAPVPFSITAGTLVAEDLVIVLVQ